MSTNRSPEDFFATRVKNAKPSPTLAVSDRARQLKSEGIDVIDLGGGDPDFITPQHIRQAAIDAMNAGDTHYVASAGTPALRNAIANKLRSDNGITVDPAKGIIVTPGGKAALFQAILAFVEPGVDVMILEPAWVSYVPMVELAGGNPIHVGLDPDANFAITRDILDAHVTPQTRILLLNSPNNPTGRVATGQELTTIADFAKEHDLLVFTDEMYEKIIYGDHRHISIATLPDMYERTLTFNGLSKAYAMTGWRLGYVAGPEVFIKKIATVHSHSVTCATSFAQAGGVAAYEGPQEIIHEMVSAWDRRRQLITDGLNAVTGLHVTPIEGAFYAFVDGRETGMSDTELSTKLLDEAHVAVVPGTAFGDSGAGHFRLSFATADDILEGAVARIRDLLGTR
ncbi:MAG TPA: pyridoxal phosphate-dependent aminotransferase [Thermomicrobiales bacterium]|nr:pyridoxal phosphate-dependent aminotransferase [Thermomicrobiales bacterium]